MHWSSCLVVCTAWRSSGVCLIGIHVSVASGGRWLDKGTRAIAHTVSFYNTETRMLTCLRLVVEFFSSGAVFVRSRVVGCTRAAAWFFSSPVTEALLYHFRCMWLVLMAV